jgi:hypothetical protein
MEVLLFLEFAVTIIESNILAVYCNFKAWQKYIVLYWTLVIKAIVFHLLVLQIYILQKRISFRVWTISNSSSTTTFVFYSISIKRFATNNAVGDFIFFLIHSGTEL